MYITTERDSMEKAVAVLFGGNSCEYEVSLMSAAAVIRHLDEKKYKPIPRMQQ